MVQVGLAIADLGGAPFDQCLKPLFVRPGFDQKLGDVAHEQAKEQSQCDPARESLRVVPTL